MEPYIARYTLRIKRNQLKKLDYIAKYNVRNKNQEILKMISDHIRAFEQEHGPIPLSREEGSAQK